MSEFVFPKNWGGPKGGGFSIHDLKTKDDLSDLAIFTRDACQNCKDRHVNFGKVNVKITLIELDGQYKKNFLESINWLSLKKHIDACSNEVQSEESRHLKNGMSDISSKAPLRMLLLEDFNTEGLTGDDDEDDGNYDLLLNSENRTPTADERGGSYGIGKKVLWHVSSIRTVLFSSFPNDEFSRGKGIRIGGKSWLRGHKINDINYQYQGLFGKKDTKETIDGASFERTYSIWNDNSLAKQLYLNRDGKTTTGTSALILGLNFNEELVSKNDQNYINKTAKLLEKEIYQSFWPSLVKKYILPVVGCTCISLIRPI